MAEERRRYTEENGFNDNNTDVDDNPVWRSVPHTATVSDRARVSPYFRHRPSPSRYEGQVEVFSLSQFLLRAIATTLIRRNCHRLALQIKCRMSLVYISAAKQGSPNFGKPESYGLKLGQAYTSTWCKIVHDILVQFVAYYIVPWVINWGQSLIRQYIIWYGA